MKDEEKTDGELKCFDQSEGFINGTSNGKIIDSDLPEDQKIIL